MKAISQWCQRNLHQPIEKQQEALARKLRGHYVYFGITGNSDGIGRFGYEVHRLWKKWLGRRSQKVKRQWDWFNRMLKCYPLPPPIAVRSTYRLAAKLSF